MQSVNNTFPLELEKKIENLANLAAKIRYDLFCNGNERTENAYLMYVRCVLNQWFILLTVLYCNAMQISYEMFNSLLA